VLRTVMVRAALIVPRRWLPKLIRSGEALATGAASVPDSVAVCGLAGALLATRTIALRAPVAVVAEATLTEQVHSAQRECRYSCSSP
jgi:hypothetical protein